MERRRWIGLLLALAVLAAGQYLLRDYQTDDTWIHLRYAHHLVTRGEYAFNPGDPTYGSTSPLWVFCLALLLKLGLAPLAAARLLGAVAAVLVLLTADRLLARLPLPGSWRPWLLLLLAADAWFLRWSASGMETPLARLMLLVLLGPVAATGPVAWLAWGCTWGLGPLTRPEIALLAPLALPWLLWLQRRRHPHRSASFSLLAVAAGWLLLVGPWLLYAHAEFGRVVPGTAVAKSYGLNLHPASLAVHLRRSLEQIAAVQGLLWPALLLTAGRFAVRRRAGRAGRGPVLGPRGVALLGIAVTWAAALVGGYAAKQVWTISRYLSPLQAPLLLAGAVAAAGLLRALLPPDATVGRRVLGTAVLLALLVNGWLLATRVAPYAREFSRGVDRCLAGTGRWLRDESPPDAVVAALDIGAVGYASERRILDLAGLVSPAVRPLGRRLGFERMVASGAWLDVAVPDYLFDRTPGPPRWAGRTVRGVRFRLLRTCRISGVGLQEQGPWTYALYRLERVPAADRSPR